MSDMNAVSITHEPSDALKRKIIGLFPAAVAMVYPFLLEAFHVAVSPSGGSLSAVRIAGAAILLVLAFAVPLSGLASAYWWTTIAATIAIGSTGTPSGLRQHRRATALCFRRGSVWLCFEFAGASII